MAKVTFDIPTGFSATITLQPDAIMESLAHQGAVNADAGAVSPAPESQTSDSRPMPRLVGDAKAMQAEYEARAIQIPPPPPLQEA